MTTESRPAACAYCKLPLPARWWNDRPRGQGRDGPSAEPGQEPLYCCLGCRIAAAILEEKSGDSATHSTLVRLGLSIFCTMNVMAFTMALWTEDVYGPIEAAGSLPAIFHGLFRHLILLFSLPVLFFLGFPLFRHAWCELRRGVLSTDWLLATGVAGSFVFSFLSVIRGQGPIYFEVGCVILVMTTLGRWFEASGKLRANAALDGLAKLVPERVRRIGAARQERQEDIPNPAANPAGAMPTTREEWVALADVDLGDLLRVLPGERFPVDGLVVRNRCLADEQVLTGESRPSLKEPGDRVFGGTLNLDGDLIIGATAVGEQGTLARLVAMVREARQSKGRYQRLAERVASRFVPAVFLIAIGAIGAHWAMGSLARGLWAGLAVTLIACPCALGLAAPLAVWSALGNAAANRVLFRSGETLERLAEIVAIRFDKTGTLTTGAARLSYWLAETDHEREPVLARAAVLAGSSSHALSKAIVEGASDFAPLADRNVTEIRVVPGRGIQGVIEPATSPIWLGSERFAREQNLVLGPRLTAAVDDAQSRGLPFCMIGWNGRVHGLFVFEEEWRQDAQSVTRWLAKAGMTVGVLTGDHDRRGRAIAEELGIHVEAQLLPAEKVEAIVRVQNTIGPVAMVGDGINDAPALAASDVGIALGCGTDVSRDSASICLLGDDLSQIPWSFELARRARQTVRWNLVWALGYNSIGIVLAALGWLNPVLAAVLMAGSSAIVTINSLRLGQPFAIALEERERVAGDSAKSVGRPPTPAVIPVRSFL
jgi:heavy metal translocating P-type ATPase